MTNIFTRPFSTFIPIYPITNLSHWTDLLWLILATTNFAHPLPLQRFYFFSLDNKTQFFCEANLSIFPHLLPLSQSNRPFYGIHHHYSKNRNRNLWNACHIFQKCYPVNPLSCLHQSPINRFQFQYSF